MVLLSFLLILLSWDLVNRLREVTCVDYCFPKTQCALKFALWKLESTAMLAEVLCFSMFILVLVVVVSIDGRSY